VIFESRPRLKWAVSFVIFINTGTFTSWEIHRRLTSICEGLGLIITLLREFDGMAWAGTSLVLNTGLTGAILGKLMYVRMYVLHWA
jgi:hypothetical protein